MNKAILIPYFFSINLKIRKKWCGDGVAAHGHVVTVGKKKKTKTKKNIQMLKR